jgi:hypothetical protein
VNGTFVTFTIREYEQAIRRPRAVHVADAQTLRGELYDVRIVHPLRAGLLLNGTTLWSAATPLIASSMEHLARIDASRIEYDNQQAADGQSPPIRSLAVTTDRARLLRAHCPVGWRALS